MTASNLQPEYGTRTRARRWRRCPACALVMPAGELLTYLDARWDIAWTSGEMRRVCPSCGYRGRTPDFMVVREQHAEGRPT